jgi:hypothetical protein
MGEQPEPVPPPEATAPVAALERRGEPPASVAVSEGAVGEQGKPWPPSSIQKKDGTTNGSFADFASSVHTYINDYISVVDQNAAFLFAAVGTTLAFLNTKGLTKLWIKNPAEWSLSEALTFLAVVGLLASAAASLFAVLPRKKGSNTGLVFWRSISRCRSADEYARLVLGTEPTELTTAKLQHCFELSQICARKYRALGWGLWCGGIGFVATLIYLAVT